MTLREQFRKIILDPGSFFIFGQVKIYRDFWNEEGKETSAVVIEFMNPSNYTNKLEPIYEKFSLIPSWRLEKFDVDCLLIALYKNRYYFRFPLKQLGERIKEYNRKRGLKPNRRDIKIFKEGGVKW